MTPRKKPRKTVTKHYAPREPGLDRVAASYQPLSFLERAALNPGRGVTQTDILAFAKASLAKFKMARTVIFTGLPKISTGKVQKFALRERERAL